VHVFPAYNRVFLIKKSAPIHTPCRTTGRILLVARPRRSILILYAAERTPRSNSQTLRAVRFEMAMFQMKSTILFGCDFSAVVILI